MTSSWAWHRSRVALAITASVATSLLHEAVSQLRGEAGNRQVADARVGVVSSGGLTPSGVLLLRADA